MDHKYLDLAPEDLLKGSYVEPDFKPHINPSVPAYLKKAACATHSDSEIDEKYKKENEDVTRLLGLDFHPQINAGMSESEIDEGLRVYFSILMVSYVMWSGVLDSSSVLQSYSIISPA